MNKLVINFTPTGMVPTKEMNPFVPIYENEIIEEVVRENEKGITLVHLHARDEQGAPTYKTQIYQKIVEGIRKYCPKLVICISTSGRNFNELDKRSMALELKPDMGSLTLSSLNFNRQASVNDPDMIKGLLDRMAMHGVNPELEVFDLGMINYAHYLISKGWIQAPYYFNIILGNIAGMQADMMSMAAATHSLPQPSIWAFGGIGHQQLTANTVAMATGGGVRVGLEDNLFWANDKTYASNETLLNRVREMAKLLGREIMKPEEFGEMGFYNKFS